jgi:metallophosphoesterase (TIGR03767 family)
VQDWDETYWAYHPDNPQGDWFGDYGFPEVRGLLQAAVTGAVASGGMPVPWYGVYGNHDSTFYGTFGVPAGLKELALGDRKYYDWKALGLDYIGDWSTDTNAFARSLNTAIRNNGLQLGSKSVTADPARKLLEQQDFMKAHFETAPNPGPVGHGFTQKNLDTGKTYWSADVNTVVRFFGLDTCNQVVGADGAIPEEQFRWLQTELANAQAEGKLAVILSHHNSLTLENSAELAIAPERLIHADEFIAMLQSFPNVVAWLNGHTHNNTITAHKKSGGGGFWEITTASCIDFPQQQQMVEFVDNRDGTLSIFTTVVDHAAPVDPSGPLTQANLAAWSRQFAANNWNDGPALRIGSELDRNTELLLPAPFDLSRVSDADVERAELSNHARLMAWEAGWTV